MPESLCNMRLFFFTMSIMVTTCSFAISALHRYASIVHNRGNMTVFQKRWQPLLLFSMWLISSIIVLPAVTSGEVVVYIYRDLCYIDGEGLVVKHIIIYGISNVISLVVIPILYMRIFLFVRNASRAVEKFEARSSMDSKKRSSTRTAVQLFLLYVTYTIAYLPSSLFLYVIPLMDSLDTKR